MLDNPDLTIVYDGECPFCSQYVKLLKLRETVGKVKLISARENSPEVGFLRAKGVILDNTMAMIQGDQFYSGAECINRLALLSTSSGLFNRINKAAFRNPMVSRIVYPVLRTGRAATLRLLGRQKMGY